MSLPSSNFGARGYPYQYHQQADLDDQDDDPSGHQNISRLNSPDISQSVHSPSTGAHLRNPPTNTRPGALYSKMDFPGSNSPTRTQDRDFEWRPTESGRAGVDSGVRSGGKRVSIGTSREINPNPQSGPYLDIDVDSLLEMPPPGSDRGQVKQSPATGHRRGNSDAVSDSASSIGVISPTMSPNHKRRSLTTALGEKAFRAPILTKATTSVSAAGGSRDLHPSEIIDQRAEMTATWGIYWYLPSLMVAVFIAGLIGALGHHAFYKSLHGTRSRDQLSMVRIGTAFAFFVKANLVGAVVIAYR